MQNGLTQWQLLQNQMEKLGSVSISKGFEHCYKTRAPPNAYFR